MAEENKKDTLERIESRLDSIDITLATNTTLLAEHIRRTELIEEDLKPIKSHVTLMNNLAKIVAAGGAILLFLKEFFF